MKILITGGSGFSDYQIGNTGPGGASQEDVRHTSRNPFHRVASAEEQRALHSTAQNFAYPKPKYNKD